ncbi:TIGR02594 family protein [Pseudoduganella violaceinigra]|uniref:TIGR02594 family protein n=1 Tax=Pseudoduganella violaceinigra TaxID=246602 RepID=UPI000486F8AC|nr:TIGR02594 family protein [Pseudoduganella violaceinigra]
MAARFVSAKYDVSTLTVDYASSDGTHLLRTGGTIAWRFNNPGNLRPTKSLKPIMGAIGVGTTKGNGSFLIYASYEEGRAQKKALLRRKFNNRTIYTMLAGVPDAKGNLIEGYAPASDKNDPKAYAQEISDHTGLPVTTKLSDISDAKLESVLDAMEKKEGFHGQKDTRKEKLIPTTTVTISDGALPKPDVPVRVQIGDKTYEQKTDKSGQLPRIAHTKPGTNVKVQVPDNKGGWVEALDFVMSHTSAAYVLFHDLMTFAGSSAPKVAPRPEQKPKRTPLRHVVAPKETLGKIAEKFETTIPLIQKDNPEIKDPAKIYVGQVIGIYGPVKPMPAAPQAPARPSPAAKEKPPAAATETTRSKKGEGAPIAVVPVNQKEAPWMVSAIAEAKTWAGKKEGVITKTTNYHKKIGGAGKLDDTPWCASFVNFCLKDSNTPYEASQSSQFPVSSKKFVKIDKPVYGALMVMRNYFVDTGKSNGSGHVTFVYGKSANGRIAALGGNQGDSIKLSAYADKGISSFFTLKGKKMKQCFHGFYIPATYTEYAKTQGELTVIDIDEGNKALLNVKIAASTNESTR